MQEPRTSFGRYLRLARIGAEFQTQQQLAVALGVQRQTISQWEIGSSRPRKKQLSALAEVLKLRLSELESAWNSGDIGDKMGGARLSETRASEWILDVDQMLALEKETVKGGRVILASPFGGTKEDHQPGVIDTVLHCIKKEVSYIFVFPDKGRFESIVEELCSWADDLKESIHKYTSYQKLELDLVHKVEDVNAVCSRVFIVIDQRNLVNEKRFALRGFQYVEYWSNPERDAREQAFLPIGNRVITSFLREHKL